MFATAALKHSVVICSRYHLGQCDCAIEHASLALSSRFDPVDAGGYPRSSCPQGHPGHLHYVTVVGLSPLHKGVTHVSKGVLSKRKSLLLLARRYGVTVSLARTIDKCSVCALREYESWGLLEEVNP